MSDYYKINEIARLYGLCADTLRYYEEQGLLSPIRGENNYRLYGIQDICALNIIQNLRSLDIPIARIRQYMEDRSVGRTLTLLEEETRWIDCRIADLENLRKGVRRRAADIDEALAQPVGRCRILNLPERSCYLLSEGVTLEEDVDFLLKKLEQKHENRLRSFGEGQMGATLDAWFLSKGVYNQYANAFYICDDIDDYDRVLPRGRYGSILYRGRYENLAAALRQLLSYLEEQGLRPAGPPMELYHIDVHDTRLREEYLTEVQVPVGN